MENERGGLAGTGSFSPVFLLKARKIGFGGLLGRYAQGFAYIGYARPTTFSRWWQNLTLLLLGDVTYARVPHLSSSYACLALDYVPCQVPSSLWRSHPLSYKGIWQLSGHGLFPHLSMMVFVSQEITTRISFRLFAVRSVFCRTKQISPSYDIGVFELDEVCNVYAVTEITAHHRSLWRSVVSFPSE